MATNKKTTTTGKKTATSTKKVTKAVEPKQLTLVDVESLHKEYEQQKEAIVGNGTFKLLIDTKFQKTKIQKFMIEFQDIVKDLRDNHGVDFESFEKIMLINYTLLIKHFTNLDIPNDVNQMIAVSTHLINTGLLEEILNEFDQTEIENMNLMIKKFAENAPQIGDIIGDIMAEKAIKELDEVTPEG